MIAHSSTARYAVGERLGFKLKADWPGENEVERTAGIGPAARSRNMDEARPEPDLAPGRAKRFRVPDLLQPPFDIRSIALTGLFILALFYTMYFMRSVLLPLVLALLLSYLLLPIVRALGRLKLNAPIAAAIVLLTLVAGVGYAISFLAAPAAGWLEKAPYSLAQLQQKLVPVRQRFERVAQASGEIEKIASPATAETKTAIEVKRHPLSDILYVRTPEMVMSAVLLLILLYFLLAHDGVFLAKIIKLTPRLADKKRAVSIAHDIEVHVSRYLLTITLINACLGIAVGTAVAFLGLRNPIMWGVMVAILNFVPYLGALTGIVCMTLGAVLSYDSLGYALLFPAVYFALATIEGNFVTPYVMGRSLTLNPVLILLSLTFWGWMWGIAGIILAVPILAAFKIFCTHIEPMAPVAEFLS
ncbi:MAG: AI-2E family transporter [Chthoniobacterales bacterium]